MNLVVGFSAGNSWMSKIIRWFTTPFGERPVKPTHTFIRVDWSDLGTDVEFGAGARGVLPEIRTSDKNVVAAFMVRDLDAAPVMREAIRAGWVGNEYGYWNAGVTGLRKLFGGVVRHLAIRSPKTMICTEFVIRFLRKAGDMAARPDIVLPGMDEETTTAPELLAEVEKLQAFERVS